MTPDPWLEEVEGDAVPLLIESNSPLIRVVAGPGSGKTYGLRRRVWRLIEGDHVAAEKILVATFTRAIARSLRQDLGAVAERVTVATLHSVALRLLRDNPAARAGFEFRFLLKFESDVMLYDVGMAFPVAGKQNARRRLLEKIQSDWAERKDLESAEFGGNVERWLRAHDGMLVGEVVPLATRALESDDIPRGAYDHVLVDEYQDLTRCEQEMVEHLWSQKGSLVVLGDDDQSIYGFRYNHPGGITDFPKHWASSGLALENIVLSENRRNGETIVELANTLMAEAGPSKPPMIPARGVQGDRHLVHWASLDEEIASVAVELQSRPNDSFLVLVPRRFVGYRLQEAIGQGARTDFREQLLESSEAQEAFTFASLIANREDRIALRTWLGFRWDRPERAEDRNAEAVASLGAWGGLSWTTVLDVADGRASPTGRGTKNVQERCSSIVARLADVPSGVSDQIDSCFDTSSMEPSSERIAWAIRDLDILRSSSHALVETGEATTLNALLDLLRYRIATRAPLTPDEVEPRVRIMTLHSAKGLEADRVIVMTLADQVVPGYAKEDEREEQRRLLYVAVTRAKDELVVSWPRLMSYADSTQNRVRVDDVRTIDGKRVSVLTRSLLLPGSLPPPIAGSMWLAR